MTERPATLFRSDLAMVTALALAPAIGLGVARFAYALILPDMRSDLDWTYAQAGWMNTSNAAGYLLGALLATRAISLAGPFRVLTAGVWACVLALVMCALLRHPLPLNAARMLAGLGAGFAFVSGGLLATGLAQRNPARASLILGIFYAGPGLGILLSGLTVPFVLAWSGPGSWAGAWAALAILCLPMAMVLRAARGEGAADPRPPRGGLRFHGMGWILGGYLLFGAGYIAYMTFMIAWVRDSGSGAPFQALFWAVIGVAAMSSPWVYAWAQRRLVHGHAFAVLMGITAIGAALPLLSDAVAVLLASAALFGSAFFAVVASTTIFVRRNVPPDGWAGAISTMTVTFGVGQMFGPVTIGLLNDAFQNLSGGLWASVLLLVIGALCGAVQSDTRTD